jgi:hypothetical protein
VLEIIVSALENFLTSAFLNCTQPETRSWLRHYDTSQKVTDSSPNEVDYFSVYRILPAALWPWGSTQPLTEMSTRNLPGGGKGWLAHKADSLIAICEPIV